VEVGVGVGVGVSEYECNRVARVRRVRGGRGCMKGPRVKRACGGMGGTAGKCKLRKFALVLVASGVC
jgi:hypothetical protein